MTAPDFVLDPGKGEWIVVHKTLGEDYLTNKVFPHIVYRVQHLSDVHPFIQGFTQGRLLKKETQMSSGEYMKILDSDAIAYSRLAKASLLRNDASNTLRGHLPSQEVIDAILVDFLNYVGYTFGLNYGMTTKNLVQPKEESTRE